MLEYKARWYGREVERVCARHTSQDCSACGYRHKDLTLSVREWTCPTRSTVQDRDVNRYAGATAKNIQKKGVGHTLSAWEIYAPEAGGVSIVDIKGQVSGGYVVVTIRHINK